MQTYSDLLCLAMRGRTAQTALMHSLLSSIMNLSAALGCGLIAGVFWAFSNFVMPALARLPAPQGMAAMQSINVVVLNQSFLGVLLGTALLCAVVALDSLSEWSEPSAWLRFAGCLLYLIGTLLVTRVCHVPRNVGLALRSADSAEAARLWSNYVAGWSAWNHVRAAAALGAAVLLTLALLTLSGS
jgi:uncharacterized membrane protein